MGERGEANQHFRDRELWGAQRGRGLCAGWTLGCFLQDLSPFRVSEPPGFHPDTEITGLLSEADENLGGGLCMLVFASFILKRRETKAFKEKETHSHDCLVANGRAGI